VGLRSQRSAPHTRHHRQQPLAWRAISDPGMIADGHTRRHLSMSGLNVVT
jgi:hypothetical protein